MSILKEVRKTLSSDGTEVYFPSQHEGECLNEYIVVKVSDAIDEIEVSSERPIYTLMLYVPKNRYSDLEDMLNETKIKMKQLFPTLRYVGNQTDSFYDDNVKGHMISIQYERCRKKENW